MKEPVFLKHRGAEGIEEKSMRALCSNADQSKLMSMCGYSFFNRAACSFLSFFSA